MSERGGASLPMLGVVGLLVLAGLGIADMGRFLALRSQAAAGADAAALAAAPVTFLPFGAAAGPVAEAARFARANGVRLLSCRCSIIRAPVAREVEVVVGATTTLVFLGTVEVRAASRAQFDPRALVGIVPHPAGR